MALRDLIGVQARTGLHRYGPWLLHAPGDGRVRVRRAPRNADPELLSSLHRALEAASAGHWHPGPLTRGRSRFTFGDITFLLVRTEQIDPYMQDHLYVMRHRGKAAAPTDTQPQRGHALIGDPIPIGPPPPDLP